MTDAGKRRPFSQSREIRILSLDVSLQPTSSGSSVGGSAKIGQTVSRRRADTQPTHLSSRWAELVRYLAVLDGDEGAQAAVAPSSVAPRIKALQGLLNMFFEFMCLPDRLDANGVFDDQTLEAVRRVKRVLGTDEEKDFGSSSKEALVHYIQDALEQRAKNGAFIR